MKPWLILGFTLFLGFSFLAYEKRHEVQQVGKVLDSTSRSKDFMNRTPELFERRIAEDMLAGRRILRDPLSRITRAVRPQRLKLVDSPESVGSKSEPPTFSFPHKHTLKEGDSCWTLAVKYYGKGWLHPMISKANKLKKLVPGMVLIIPSPPPEAIKKVKNQRVNSTKTGADSVKPSAFAAPKLPPPSFYMVKKNDTLSGIAERLLGSSRHMYKFYEVNKSLKLEYTELHVGMILRVPKLITPPQD